MKIKDILNIISEAPAQPAAPTATNAATLKAAQDAAAKGKPGTTAPAQPAASPAGQVAAAGTKPGGTAGQRPTMANDPRLNGGGVAAQPTKPAAKKDPAVEKRQKELIAAGAQIKADGISGPATTKAEAEFGWKTGQAPAATGPGNVAPPAATDAASLAAAQNKEPATDPNAPAQSTMADGPAVGSQAPTAQADVEKAKLGIAAGSPALQPQAPNQSPDEIARLQALAGAQPASNGYRGNFSTVASNARPGDTAGSGSPMAGVKPPSGQAAQPVQQQPAQPVQQQPAPVSTVQPAVQSAGGPVKSGDGSTVKSRSDLEIAWAGLPGNRGKQYPGDAVAQQQVGADTANRQKNMDALKGVGNKISNFLGGNKQPAVTMENEELNRLVSLIRHR